MSKTVNLILFSRKRMLELLAGLTPEQMNTVPPGFNNNLVWNIAHVIAVQQGLCYARAGLKTLIDPQMINDYQRGTFPKDHVTMDDIETIKQLAISTAEQFATDIKAGLFKGFPPFVLPAQNINLQTIEDAAEFILYHEGMHSGYIQALKRAIGITKEEA